MKKLLLSMLALCMSVSMFGRTIYLNTTTVDYGADNAFLAIWTWGGTSSDAWSVFSAVPGEEKLFSAEIADDKTGGKIIRFDSSVTEPSWGASQWNQTGDLTIPSDANMITLTQWKDETPGSWSTYTPVVSTDPAVALTVTGDTKLGSEVTLSAAASNIEGEVTYKYYVKVGDGEFTALEADKYTFEALGTYTFKVEAKVGDEVQATDTKEVTITNVVTEYYLVGYINGADYGCNDDYTNLGEYKFVDGKLTATFTKDSYVFVKTGDNNNWYMSETYVEPAANVVATLKQGKTITEKVGVKANVEVSFTLTNNGDGTLTLAYSMPAVALTVTGTTELGSEVTLSAAVSNIEGEVTYKYYVKVDDGEFTALEADKYTFEALGTYTFKVEAIAGEEVKATDTKEVTITNVVTEYYLIGYINGANYGCEEDYANLGEYKFVDGKLTATFTKDSYVFVKTGDNNNWYMSETYVEPAANVVATLKQGETTTEKVGVKANVEVSFTLTNNGDGTLTLAYTTVGTTALQAVTMADIYANNGRIYGADDMRIYTVSGMDVTDQNGQLNGIYIVKTQAGIVKVVVR